MPGVTALTIASLKQFDVPRIGDFDQGAIEGFGHAFIAGSDAITFIDYSASGDITNPGNKIVITGGFGNIDDIAPLVGLGAPPPRPARAAIKRYWNANTRLNQPEYPRGSACAEQPEWIE